MLPHRNTFNTIYLRFFLFCKINVFRLIIISWWNRCTEQWQQRREVRETETGRDGGEGEAERPSAAPPLVVLTQIQHWNMATMWTPSKSVARALARPIGGDLTVRGGGGGAWGWSASLREREIKACERRRRVRAEEPHLLESWTIHINGDRSDIIS